MLRYVALLRGINVGGHKKVPMAELKDLLQEKGLKNVITLLASGNVVFDSSKQEEQLKDRLAQWLADHFGFEIPVIVRSMDVVRRLVDQNPFEKIIVTKDIRLYVSFLATDVDPGTQLPFSTEDHSYTILAEYDRLVISVLDLSKTGTTDGMAILEKQYGKNITTRNWNTVMKIATLDR